MAEYFRQFYALEWNQWQLEHMKTPELIEPIDVIRFPGERRKRKGKTRNKGAYSPEQLAELERKLSNPPTETDPWPEPLTYDSGPQ